MYGSFPFGGSPFGGSGDGAGLTLYWAIQPSGTANWADNATGGGYIRDGKDGAGSALPAGSYGSQAYTAAGQIDMAVAASGLTPGQSYEFGFVLYDSAADEYSNVVVSAALVTLNAYTLDVTSGAYAITGQSVGLTAGTTLDVSAGSYQVTGQDVGLLTSRKVAITPGSYSISGQSVDLLYGALNSYSVDITPGAYAITGQSAGLAADKVLGISTGGYALTGSNVGLTYTPLGSFLIDITPGAYAVSGQSVGLVSTRTIDVTTGTYALSGQNVELYSGIGLIVTPGSYAVTGQDVALAAALQLAITTGLYALTGNSVLLTYSGAPVDAVFPDPATVIWGITYGPTGADYTGTLLVPTADDIATAVWSKVLPLTP